MLIMTIGLLQIARVFKVPLDDVFQYPDGESR